MSQVQIVQIKCPNCGGQANTVGTFSQMRVCAFCKTEFHVTGTMSKEMEIPERMVPFLTTKDEFESNVLAFLANDELAPDNIFELTSFDDVEGLYLPMFLYEGKYNSTWNCSVGYEENEVRVSGDKVKNKTVIKYRPMSGSCADNYAFVCIAYDGKEVKPELADYARSFPYEATVAKTFDPKYLEGFNFLLHNLDKETTWSKWGEITVKEIAEKQSLDNVPGQTYKDFRSSVATEPRHDGRLVFIPFWAIYYNYEDKTYFVLMDGTGKNGVYGSTPIDEQRQKKFKLWGNIPKWSKWASFASLLLLFANPEIAIILFALLFIGSFVLKFVGNKIIENTIKASQDLRHQRLNDILSKG